MTSLQRRVLKMLIVSADAPFHFSYVGLTERRRVARFADHVGGRGSAAETKTLYGLGSILLVGLDSVVKHQARGGLFGECVVRATRLTYLARMALQDRKRFEIALSANQKRELADLADATGMNSAALARMSISRLLADHDLVLTTAGPAEFLCFLPGGNARGPSG